MAAVGRIEHGVDIVRAGPPPDPDVPLVVQVSRWDRLKDMTGVLAGSPTSSCAITARSSSSPDRW